MNEKTYLEVLSNFTDKTLEGEFANEKFSGLLVSPDFTESDSSGPEAMRLLHTTGSGLRVESDRMTPKSTWESTYGGLTGSGGLCSKLLTRGLATSGLASGLLSAGHCKVRWYATVRCGS